MLKSPTRPTLTLWGRQRRAEFIPTSGHEKKTHTYTPHRKWKTRKRAERAGDRDELARRGHTSIYFHNFYSFTFDVGRRRA